MGFHVSVVKRVGKEVQVNVWGDGMSLSLPIEKYLNFLIEISGFDGEKLQSASDEILKAMKAESVRYVK
jgi:hypothetical protein